MDTATETTTAEVEATPAKKARAKATPKQAAGKAKAKAKKVVAAVGKMPAEMVAKFDEAYKKWKKGGEEGRICHLAADIGCRRGALRRQLRKRAAVDLKTKDGHAAFKTLRAKGSGGRPEHLGAAPRSTKLDEGAVFISAAQRAKEGWTSRTVRPPKGDSFPVYVLKTGVEYRGARATEKADILAEMGNGLPAKRMVVYATKSGVVSE